MSVQELLTTIEKLPLSEQQELLTVLEKNVKQQTDAQTPVSVDEESPTGKADPKRSIMELHGLGKDIQDGVDAQEYINELRREWEHRP